ncbi:hypothetical protein DFJ73DRAFT_841958 [Zopfochytrium polystomum]|nr:hypothetical protein DFJ73DRAFT_841958 [Zopfochytrium polystomum]
MSDSDLDERRQEKAEFGYRLLHTDGHKLPALPYIKEPEGAANVVHVSAVGSKKGRVKSLKEMTAIAIARSIDCIESLENVPWHLACCVLRAFGPTSTDKTHKYRGAIDEEDGRILPMSMTAVQAFSKAFPESCGQTEHYLWLSGFDHPERRSSRKLSEAGCDSAQPATEARLTVRLVLKSLESFDVRTWLKILDLSWTGFDDFDANIVAQISSIEILDLSSTKTTLDTLRTLARPLQNKIDPGTGHPRQLHRLQRMSLELRFTGQPSSVGVTLNKFPVLVVADVGGTSVAEGMRNGRVYAWDGWVKVDYRVNLFPGFRGRRDLHRARLKEERIGTTQDSVTRSEETGVIPRLKAENFFGKRRAAAHLTSKEEMFTSRREDPDRSARQHAEALDDSHTETALAVGGWVADTSRETSWCDLLSRRRGRFAGSGGLSPALPPRNGRLGAILAAFGMIEDGEVAALIQRRTAWWAGRRHDAVWLSRLSKGDEVAKRVESGQSMQDLSEMKERARRALERAQNERWGMVRRLSSVQAAMEVRRSAATDRVQREKERAVEELRLQQEAVRSKRAISIPKNVVPIKRSRILASAPAAEQAPDPIEDKATRDEVGCTPLDSSKRIPLVRPPSPRKTIVSKGVRALGKVAKPGRTKQNGR